MRWSLFTAVVAIFLIVVALSVFRSSSSATPEPVLRGENLLPFQTLVRDVPSHDQRTFHELREGLLEAERIRAATGRWPDGRTLAAQGVAPFAAGPDRTEVSYRWSTLVQGVAVNYVGIPSTPAADAWLLVVLEPEPGSPPDPAPDDETHHRLPDGTTLHASIWHVPEKSRMGGFATVQFPQHDGWRQLLLGKQVP